jgi:iron complex outermembrane recepter protein
MRTEKSSACRFAGAAFLLLLGSLVTAPGASLQAQTGTVQGTVVAQDGSLLAGAQVIVVGTGRGALSDSRGAFRIAGVPVGTHTLQAQRIGFSTAEIQIQVAAGATVVQQLRLVQGAISLDAVAVTVGSRVRHTAADELAVPVDVYTRDEIVRASPQMELATALAELSPAIYFPRPQIADVTSGVRPFQLRGLSPDHSLVLINGKRRHPTAVVHVFGAASGGSGSSGVDMNSIVPAALGGMEVLRDGAAAQYGSDAIAGVLNLQLRSDVHRPQLNVSVGQYNPRGFDGDGERAEMDGSAGFALGSRGSIVFSGMFSQREPTHRAGADPRDQIVPGDADVVQKDADGIQRVVQKRNDAPQPNHLIGDGRTKNTGAFWNARYLVDQAEEHTFYSFGGYTWRKDIHSGFYRRGIDARNWPDIHPVGFLPKFRGITTDFMLVSGLEGLLGPDWRYDVSAQWNRNWVDIDIFDSHNVSLGPCLGTPCAPGPWPQGVGPVANKTDVFAGSVAVNQAIVALDVVREVEVGFHSPLNVALGTAFRGDNFQLHAGEPASWVNGWHPNRDGGIAPPGSQVFTGYRPDQEANEWRTNIGLYADLEADLTSAFRLAVAGRFENYSDFGSTLTGKVAARLQPHERLILRSAVSTGFRAPNLSQSFYAHVSTGFRADPDNPGNQIAYEIGEIPVNSPEARALGAEPLTEEKSVNLSGGLAFSPTENLTFTVDGYQIDVDDRIILTGSLSGPTVEQLLAPFGAPTVKFFTNSVDTRTRGLDVSGRYRHLLRGNQYLEFLGQFNRNYVRVTDVAIPDVIEELRNQVFTSGERYAIENGRPRNRTTFRSRYVRGAFDVALSANHYGVQSFRHQETGTLPAVCNNPPSGVICLPSGAVFQENGPHLVLNGDVGFDVNDRFRIQAGAENLTNRRPPVRPDGFDFSGIFPFFSTSGLHMNGQYLWTKVSVRF